MTQSDHETRGKPREIVIAEKRRRRGSSREPVFHFALLRKPSLSSPQRREVRVLSFSNYLMPGGGRLFTTEQSIMARLARLPTEGSSTANSWAEFKIQADQKCRLDDISIIRWAFSLPMKTTFPFTIIRCRGSHANISIGNHEGDLALPVIFLLSIPSFSAPVMRLPCISTRNQPPSSSFPLCSFQVNLKYFVR